MFFCCCCESIYDNDLRSADGTAAERGTWSFDAADGASVSAASAALEFDCQSPPADEIFNGFKGAAEVWFKIMSSLSGPKLILLSSTADLSQYIAAGVIRDAETGCFSIRFEMIDTLGHASHSDLPLPAQLSIGTWFKLRVCWVVRGNLDPPDERDNPPVFTAQVSDSVGPIMAPVQWSPSGGNWPLANRHGVGTFNTTAGPVYFRDWKIYPHPDNDPSCPTCDLGCDAFRDAFRQADQGLPTTWCPYTFTPAANWWHIASQRLTRVMIGSPPTPPPSATLNVTLSDDFNASVVMNLPASDSYAILKVALTASTFVAVKVLPKSPGQECGIMQFQTSQEGTGRDVFVPGLEAGTDVTVTLCYLSDLQHLTASVTTPSGDFWMHLNSISPTAAERTNELSLTTGNDDGIYQFDDLTVRKLPTDDDGYGYGYGVENQSCPCCRRADCESDSDDFTHALPLDCRWSQDAGTWTIAEDDGITTSDDNARLLWTGSWSGLTDDCQVDSTARVSTTFTSTGYADIIAAIGYSLADSSYVYALLSLSGDTGFTLALKTSAGETLKSQEFPNSPRPTNLIVCFDGEDLMALAGTDYVVMAWSPSSFGELAGVGTGQIDSAVTFTSVTISHDLKSTCADCWDDLDKADGQSGNTEGGETLPPAGQVETEAERQCALCTDGTPKYFLVSLTGAGDCGEDCLCHTTQFGDPIEGQTHAPTCGAINRSWLVERMPQFDGIGGQCAWRLAGVDWISDVAGCVATQDGVTRRAIWGSSIGAPVFSPMNFVEVIQWCNFLWNFEQTNFQPTNPGGWALNAPKHYSPWFARYCEGHADSLNGTGNLGYYISAFAVAALDISPGDADHPGQVLVTISGLFVSVLATSAVNGDPVGGDCILYYGQTLVPLWSGYVAGPPCQAVAGSLPFTGEAPQACQVHLTTAGFHVA